MVKILLLLRSTTIPILQSVSLNENCKKDGWTIIVVAVHASDFVACFGEIISISFFFFFFFLGGGGGGVVGVCDLRVR